MFEVATRTKMRFPYRGQVSVEDLWDLDVEELDSIFKVLNTELKQTQEESLLNTRTKRDKELDVQIDIIKYIVQVKQEEAMARKDAKARREQKQKIMEIMAAKKDEALSSKSLEELQAELDNLG
jgi:glycine cleavage system protein P-like pyridoxal-binding family